MWCGLLHARSTEVYCMTSPSRTLARMYCYTKDRAPWLGGSHGRRPLKYHFHKLLISQHINNMHKGGTRTQGAFSVFSCPACRVTSLYSSPSCIWYRASSNKSKWKVFQAVFNNLFVPWESQLFTARYTYSLIRPYYCKDTQCHRNYSKRRNLFPSINEFVADFYQ